MEEKFKEFGIDSTEDELNKLGGLSSHDTVLHFSKNKKLTNERIREICSRKGAIIKELDSLIKPFWVLGCLKELKERGVLLYVVTGSIRSYAKKQIEKYFIDVFDDVISASDVKKSKPHPDPYLKAWKYVGLDKDDCVIVEDAPLGVQSGKSAGFRVFAITTTLSKEYLENADRVFESHKDLFNYLKSIID